MVTLSCCLFASFVVFSLLWLKITKLFTFYFNLYMTKRFRSGWSLLNLIGCVFRWVWRVLIGLVIEEQVLILLDSSEPKEAMSQDAVVTLFTLLLKAIVLCLLS